MSVVNLFYKVKTRENLRVGVFFPMMLVQLFVAVIPTMMTLYVDYEKTEWVGRAYI